MEILNKNARILNNTYHEQNFLKIIDLDKSGEKEEIATDIYTSATDIISNIAKKLIENSQVEISFPDSTKVYTLKKNRQLINLLNDCYNNNDLKTFIEKIKDDAYNNISHNTDDTLDTKKDIEYYNIMAGNSSKFGIRHKNKPMKDEKYNLTIDEKKKTLICKKLQQGEGLGRIEEISLSGKTIKINEENNSTINIYEKPNEAYYARNQTPMWYRQAPSIYENMIKYVFL